MFCETDEPEKRCHWFRAFAIQRLALLNRRVRDRRNAADGRCTGRQRRSRDEFAISLPRRRTIGIFGGVAGHATTRKGIAVGVGRRETVSKCFQKRDDLVFLLIRQAEHTRRRVEVVRDLFHRPTGHPFDRSLWAVSGSDREGKFGVARVIEMYELFRRRNGTKAPRRG